VPQQFNGSTFYLVPLAQQQPQQQQPQPETIKGTLTGTGTYAVPAK